MIDNEYVHKIASECGVNDIVNSTYTDRWMVFERCKWELKNMDLDEDVYEGAVRDVENILEL